MTIEDQIRDEKLQYDINREAAKISTLSSSRNDTFEYLTGEEILPSNRQQMIQQAKFTYYPLRKAFEKQTKTIQDQKEKQADALKALKPKELKPNKTKPIECDNYFINGLLKIRDFTKTIDCSNLTYNFTDDSVPISFIGFKGPPHILKSIYNGDLTLEDVEKDKKNLNQI